MSFTLPTDTSAITKDDLRRLTGVLLDDLQRTLRRCVDADVTFEPIDPLAEDRDAASPDQANQAWTLGHILAHVTASAEESAAVAAEPARGVAYHGRSRREVPWETVTTLTQCRMRLEESRRMRLVSLEMWPARPALENTYTPWEGAPTFNALSCFYLGLRHEAGHLAQLRDVIGQARQWRW
jgi:hypothetical protein